MNQKCVDMRVCLKLRLEHLAQTREGKQWKGLFLYVSPRKKRYSERTEQVALFEIRRVSTIKDGLTSEP